MHCGHPNLGIFVPGTVFFGDAPLLGVSRDFFFEGITSWIGVESILRLVPDFISFDFSTESKPLDIAL